MKSICIVVNLLIVLAFASCVREPGVTKISSKQSAFSKFRWTLVECGSFECYKSGRKYWLKVEFSKDQYENFLLVNELESKLDSTASTISIAEHNNAAIRSYSEAIGESWMPEAKPIAAFGEFRLDIVVYALKDGNFLVYATDTW